MKRSVTLGLGIVALTVLMALLLLAGCGRSESSKESSAAPAVGVPQANEAAAAPGAPSAKAAVPESAMPRKIIYSADVSLTVDNIALAAHDIESKIKLCDGFIADSELGGGGGENRTGTWKIRVPTSQFQTFLSSLSGVGDVQETKISSQDVSEEFYDVAARLRNKQTEEERLIQHLKASTAQLSDILTVERELSRVREEIERIQGRLRFLSNQTDLSTITLTVRERGVGAKSVPSFVSQIGTTFSGSVKAIGDVARGLTLVVIALFPWLLILGAIGTPFYLRARRRRQITRNESERMHE